jgi:hypothetical protein
MPQAVGYHANLNPIGWTLRQPQITANFVKLSPTRCNLAESTLAAIPTLVVRASETVATARMKPQPANILD